jgi:hypothetical protein
MVKRHFKISKCNSLKYIKIPKFFELEICIDNWSLFCIDFFPAVIKIKILIFNFNLWYHKPLTEKERKKLAKREEIKFMNSTFEKVYKTIQKTVPNLKKQINAESINK